MRYLVRLGNEGKYQPSDSSSLSVTAKRLVESSGASVGNLRVSNAAVEFDLFVNEQSAAKVLVPKLASAIGEVKTVRRLDVEEKPLTKQEAVERSVALFNEERFWEAHEVLEQVWRKESGVEKEILQGLILIAAALVHLQKSRTRVCLSVTKRAYDKLRSHKGRYFGIELDLLKVKIREGLERQKPEFFRIEQHGSVA